MIFKNKKCYIFPYSRLSENLKDYLIDNEAKFLGFIDNDYKNKKQAISIDSINNNFDYILIFSPNYSQSIYNQLIQIISKLKIICVSLSIYNIYNFSYNIVDMLTIEEQEKKDIQDIISKFSIQYQLENKILLIGIDFIDLNIKYLYLYLKKYSKYNVYLATDSLRDIKIFNSYGINVIYIYSLKFFELIFKCKIKIIDHTPVSQILIDCMKVGKSIQLWHGITIEKLGHLANYKVIEYDRVLSTSQFVSDYSFSKLYRYKKLLHCGYPRNDILYFDNIELINVDLQLLNQMQNDNNKYIIYMPTHRLYGFKNNPINYKQLNDFGKKYNIKFIIKMHPFIAEQFREDLSKYQTLNYKFTNLIIYPANMDIYPLLKYSDMLIADYSSVYFDYLFVDKPIVFFPYDYKEWIESEKGTRIDYFSYSPGDKCYNVDELLEKILDNLKYDSYKIERKNIFNKMFFNQTKQASYLLMQEIENMLENSDE